MLACGIRDALSYTTIKFFTNDFDTVTRGIDVSAAYVSEGFGGETTYHLSFGYLDTQVTKFNPDIVTEHRVRLLEESLPKTRAVVKANHRRGVMRITGRLRYCGSFLNESTGSDAELGYIEGSKEILDGEIAYSHANNLTLAIGAENLLDE